MTTSRYDPLSPADADLGACVRASVIRDALTAILPPTLSIVCEQSGGGTATMYVGTRTYTADGDIDARAWLAIGPGTYDWSNSWHSTFHYSELSIGPDGDDWDGDYRAVESLAELVAYVRALPIA